jgi:hypothetical protein
MAPPSPEFVLTPTLDAGAVIEINPTDTDFTAIATLSLRGPAGAVLERLLQLVLTAEGAKT